MDPQRLRCKCPKSLQKICKQRATGKETAVDNIIATLELEQYWKKKRREKPPKFKYRKFKPLPIKQKWVPMVPPMYERLKFISHCDPEPYIRKCGDKPTRIRYQEEIVEDDAEKAKRLCLEQEMLQQWRKCRIHLGPGARLVKHADSDTSLIRVPSPKVSGTRVAARRAPVIASELKPPLPSKTAFNLYKTHSGIVINEDDDYSPEPRGGGRLGTGKKKKKPACAQGGICMRRTCRKRRCRRYAAMRRYQRELLARTKGYRVSTRPCRAMLRRNIRRGITDGKPRARYLKSGQIPQDPTGCGLDDVERPDYATIPKGLKKGAFKTHSLTVLPCTKDRRPDVHYGILLGSFNLFGDRFGKNRGRQGLPMSIMAYCLAYHYHPKQWNSKLIDLLMTAGDQWYSQLLEKVHDHAAYQGICEVVPYGKQRVLLLNKKKMQILLCEPEIVGYTMNEDPTVYNLCRGLKAFYSVPGARACILITRLLKIAIWKDKVCYYIFDPAGRDANAYSNYANGFAALINVLDLNSVIDILLARSILEDQKFVLAPIKVLAMVNQKADDDLESEVEPSTDKKAKMSYKILSQNLAVVNGKLHLGDNLFGPNKYKQALTMAVAALTYAKISPPNTWYSKSVDKILRLGDKLYSDFKNPKYTFELGLDNIPNEIVMGPYTCEIIIYRDRTKGQLFTSKECILNIRSGLEDFFAGEHNGGIIDFSNYKLAVWRQKDMYYLFDPYPRNEDGERTTKGGNACVLMLLDTDAIAEAFVKNWDFLPATAPFSIHAFKVLKVAKKPNKNDLTVTLSATKRKARSRRHRQRMRDYLRPRSAVGGSLPASRAGSRPASGAPSRVTIVSRMSAPGAPMLLNRAPPLDEEYLGEIVSLVDSIQEDYLPPIPPDYKNAPPEIEPETINDLDSPTVSVTQVVPPWPKPRDKTDEPPEPDPDPVPSPPPTPPPPVPPEGLEEEEEEELDEEQLAAKLEEERRRRLEEEEARRRAEMLPPPIPPPPPTPLLEDEGQQAKQEIGEMIGLRRRRGRGRGGRGAPGDDSAAGTGYSSGRGGYSSGGSGAGSRGAGGPGSRGGGRTGSPGSRGGFQDGDEIEMQDDDCLLEPVPVERYVLLTVDAKRRYKLRQKQERLYMPTEERPEEPPYLSKDGTLITTSPHNFIDLLDMSQIIRGTIYVDDNDTLEVLPFVSIMAVVLSHKYSIDTWNKHMVDFCVESGQKLHAKKYNRFQACAMHIMPKIVIGHDAYGANIDVVTDGPTWALEDILVRKFFPKYDRGIITTPFYSCAFFRKGGLYYLFDGSECSPMGIREMKEPGAPKKDKKKKKKAKKDNKKKDKDDDEPNEGTACFVRFLNLSDMTNRILYNKNGLTDDAQCILSRVCVRRILTGPLPRLKLPDDYDYDIMSPRSAKSKPELADATEKKTATVAKGERLPVGYQEYDGIWRIIGTTHMQEGSRKEGEVAPEHFVCVMAMLMAAMHPFHTWDSYSVDVCIETGTEIAKKAGSMTCCEKRIIKNIVMDGKFIDLNVKKIIVINENPEKYLEQYMKAVMNRLRYVLVRFPGCNLTVVRTNDCYYHVFDPLVPPKEEPEREVKKQYLPKKIRTLEQIERDHAREKLEKEEEELRKRKELRKQEKQKKEAKPTPPLQAGWTRYKTLEGVIDRIKSTFNSRKGVKKEHLNCPTFYTFELTSVRRAPKCAMFGYKLSPLFKPDRNPNARYMRSPRPRPLVDEKMFWLNIDVVPWSRSQVANDRGVPRGSPAAKWKCWDIEFPGDLYSLWGTVHPCDLRFPSATRGQQYLACCIVSLVVANNCDLGAWTPRYVDAIVLAGDKYHEHVYRLHSHERNHVVVPEDYDGVPCEMYPFSFIANFKNVVFGFVYNTLQDRFNLSRALEYFFEKYRLGLFVCPRKNFGFGRIHSSYFMFDCQSSGAPLFNAGAYILKCESLNRLVYCMTIALNLRVHNQKFHLYTVSGTITTHESAPPHGKRSTTSLHSLAESDKSSDKSSKSAKSSASAKSAKSTASKTNSAKSTPSKTSSAQSAPESAKSATSVKSATDSAPGSAKSATESTASPP